MFQPYVQQEPAISANCNANWMSRTFISASSILLLPLLLSTFLAKRMWAATVTQTDFPHMTLCVTCLWHYHQCVLILSKHKWCQQLVLKRQVTADKHHCISAVTWLPPYANIYFANQPCVIATFSPGGENGTKMRGPHGQRWFLIPHSCG